MLSLTWVGGLLRRRPGRLLGAALGVALAVGLLGAIGSFLAAAKATMTTRATAGVPVDWQVEAQAGADPTTVLATVRARRDVAAAGPVGFAATTGLQADSGSTTQTTGPGIVVGIPPAYESTFPGELRPLLGPLHGVLLAQQTAANLHAGPGDRVSIGRAGMDPAQVTVDGVVDLPQANSLFQKVGVAAGAQPTAPPDNVVLVPDTTWHSLFDPLGGARPDLVRSQVHVRLTRRLPHDPAAAFGAVSGAARNLEVRLAGTGRVGDNLAAALDAARGDSLYAQALFVFLGLPGAVLAGLLTATLGAAGGDRRRRELAWLRTRGATEAVMGRVALAETAVVATAGAAAGLGAAAVIGAWILGSATFGTTGWSALGWAAGATTVGAVIAAASIAGPARRDARSLTVTNARQLLRRSGRARRPWWARVGLDLWLLAGAAIVIWLTGRTGYQLVLAPEGVPSVSVSWWALAGPGFLWVGAGLLLWRVGDGLAGRGSVLMRAMTRPVAAGLSRPVASALRRQRARLALSGVVVALAVAFAVSTSVFDTTYRHQAGVDALLTNGADVTVTTPPGLAPAPGEMARLAAVPGVRRVEPLQHRFAYVGSDLQDLYGVRPDRIGPATRLQDAYFSGGSARGLLGVLARRPDSILVSAETAHDFQLHPGDLIRLRLRGAGGTLVEVPFHFAGVAKEFPTAPKDSFLVANAAYISSRTGDPVANVALLDTGGSPPGAVAGRVRAVVGAGATVTDLSASRRQVGSSLTAVDLGGLTRVELAFALALAAAATGLLLAVGLAERRRTVAITRALGARSGQVGAFTRAEALHVVVVGVVGGLLAGWALAEALVRVLRGVFDPPPSRLFVPWGYLGTLIGLAVLATALAAEGTLRASRRPVAEVIREL